MCQVRPVLDACCELANGYEVVGAHGRVAALLSVHELFEAVSRLVVRAFVAPTLRLGQDTRREKEPSLPS